MANSFGNSIKISIFGESHSAAIGVVMDGLPSGLTVDLDEVQKEMDRRAPGRNRLSTPRHEADIPHVVSGLFHGKTTGTPLCAVIENTNTRSGDYTPTLPLPRLCRLSRRRPLLRTADGAACICRCGGAPLAARAGH